MPNKAGRIAALPVAGLAYLGGFLLDRYGNQWLDSPSGQSFQGHAVEFLKYALKAWGDHPAVAVLVSLALFYVALAAWDAFNRHPDQPEIRNHSFRLPAGAAGTVAIDLQASHVRSLSVRIEAEPVPGTSIPPTALAAHTPAPEIVFADGVPLIWVHLLIQHQEPQALELRVFLDLLSPVRTQRRLMMSTNDGPTDELLLQPNMVARIPLIVRAEAESWVSGDPRRLQHMPVLPWIARFTDVRALAWRDQFIDVLPASGAAFRLRVEARDGRSWRSLPWTFFNPASGTSNIGIVLSNLTVDVPDDSWA